MKVDAEIKNFEILSSPDFLYDEESRDGRNVLYERAMGMRSVAAWLRRKSTEAFHSDQDKEAEVLRDLYRQVFAEAEGLEGKWRLARSKEEGVREA